MKLILVDTSVWIDFFKNVENDKTNLLADLFVNENMVCTCPVILQEVLQGIGDDNFFYRVKKDLETFDLLLLDQKKAAIGAVGICRELRKKGITIRKSNDCLIAHYAISHNAILLQNDRDFNQIAQYTDLKLL